MKKMSILLIMLVCSATLSFAQTKTSKQASAKNPSIEVVLNQQVEMLNARIDSMTIAHQEAIEIVKNEQKEQYVNYYNQLDSNNSMAWVILSLIWGAISIVFGIVIPLIINNKSEERVNANVKDLKDQVKSDTDDLKQRLYISLQNNAKAQNIRNDNFKKQFSQIIQKETNLLNSRIEEQKRYVDNIKEDVENYEKSTKIHQLIGEAQTVLEKDSNRAIEIYSQVLELDNKNETALLWRGIAYSLLGKSTDALADLNAALAINPRLARAYNNIGNVYAADERYELAETNYNKALEINPQYDVVYRNIALMYLNQDIHLDKAEYNLNKAISYNNEYIEAYITRAQMYRRMSEREDNEETKNKYKEWALADIKQARRLKRNNDSE